MADEDEQQGRDDTAGAGGPSLELPSLGFRRKRKKDAPPVSQPVGTPTEPVPEPEPEPERPAPAARKPQPFPERPTEPSTVARPAAEPRIRPAPAPVARTTEDATDAAVATKEAEEDSSLRPGPSMPALPTLAPTVAGTVAGLVVGLVVVGLTWASQGVCQLARGTTSCGNAGFLLLLAVLVIGAWLGGALLRGFGVEDGGSTSFLAVGIVAIVLMLFLTEALFSWWMVIVVPLVSVAAYVGSHRVTTAMVEPGGPELRR